MEKFWKKKNVKNYLIKDLFDTDEIVRMFGGCPNNEDYKIERIYYYWEWQGDENYEVIYTTKEDYEKHKDDESLFYGSDLNYKDFEDKFWFDSFEDVILGKVEIFSRLDFIKEIDKAFYKLKFEVQAKLFLKEVLESLDAIIRQLNRMLNHKNIDSDIEINKIREFVLNTFKQSYFDAKSDIYEGYKFIFPDIENNFNIVNEKYNFESDRKKILKYLISDELSLSKFNEFEMKLINSKYLNSNCVWNKSAADLIRFYSFCESKKIFKYHFEDNKKGINYLRELYDFHEGKNIDTPSKRKLQLIKSKKNIFDFLND